MEEHVSVNAEECIACGMCVEVCPTTPCVFQMNDVAAVVVHLEVCEECMLCVENCPTNAIVMTGRVESAETLPT